MNIRTVRLLLLRRVLLRVLLLLRGWALLCALRVLRLHCALPLLGVLLLLLALLWVLLLLLLLLLRVLALLLRLIGADDLLQLLFGLLGYHIVIIVRLQILRLELGTFLRQHLGKLLQPAICLFECKDTADVCRLVVRAVHAEPSTGKASRVSGHHIQDLKRGRFTCE